jgi:hypothetical protein
MGFARLCLRAARALLCEVTVSEQNPCGGALVAPAPWLSASRWSSLSGTGQAFPSASSVMFAQCCYSDGRLTRDLWRGYSWEAVGRVARARLPASVGFAQTLRRPYTG